MAVVLAITLLAAAALVSVSASVVWDRSGEVARRGQLINDLMASDEAVNAETPPLVVFPTTNAISINTA